MDKPFRKQKHLLHLFVKEPIASKVKPALAAEVGDEEACLKYQAILLTLLQQFDGIEDTDIIINVSPADAVDAVKFWILSAIEDASIKLVSEHTYLFKSKKSNSALSLTFQPAAAIDNEERFNNLRKSGYKLGYKTVSIMGANCPECGTRWLKMAQMIAESKQCYVHGCAPDDSYYLTTYTKNSQTQYQLPVLQKIKSQQDWNDSLDSTLGAKLKKQYAKVQN